VPVSKRTAGVLGTIDYLEWLGRLLGSPARRRAALVAAMEGCVHYERFLGERLIAGLAKVGATLYGPPTMAGRVPTFAFRIEGRDTEEVAAHLAARGIHAWSGHFYAVEPVTRYGLWDQGGFVRVGLCHYSTAGEVDALIEALRGL
jgi:selenocysteine lyase/cysteine desulfurase